MDRAIQKLVSRAKYCPVRNSRLGSATILAATSSRCRHRDQFNALQRRYFASTGTSSDPTTTTTGTGNKPIDTTSVIQNLLQKPNSWTVAEWRESERALCARMAITTDTIHWSFQLLDRMAREAQSNPSFNLTTKHVNQVIDRWRIGTRHRRVVDPKRWSAPHVLKLVESYARNISSLSLNTKTYAMIMAVQIKLNPSHSHSLCTDIIERMNVSTTAPLNAVAMTYLMDAHVQSGQSNAVFAAQSIFDFLMEKAYENPDMMPTDKSLTRVLQAWVTLSNATVDEALPYMQRNLHFMIDAAQNSPEILSSPEFLDVVLQDCSKRAKSVSSIVLADALLQHVMDLATNDQYFHLIPYPKTLSRIILLWSDHASDNHLPNAPQRAEYWLDEMCRLWKQNPTTFESPRYTVYCAAIAAWAKSNASEAPQRAETIWRRMQQDIAAFKIGTAQTILSLWCQHGNPIRAEQFLRELVQEATKAATTTGIDSTTLLPSYESFVQVIQAWRKQGSNDAVTHAHDVMNLLMQQFTLHPNHFKDKIDETPFLACLELWACSAMPDRESKVETLWTWMKEAGISPSCQSLLPTISCLSASKATDRFRQLFSSQSITTGGDQELLPDIYERLLQQWAACPEDTNAGEYSQQLLEEFLALPTSLVVTTTEQVLRCFSHVVTARKNSTGSDSEASLHIQTLLDRASCIAQESVDTTGNLSALALISELWARSGLDHSAERSKIYFSQLVDHCHSKGMQAHPTWYENMISAFVEYNNVTEAEAMLERARMDEVALTSRMYSPLIKVFSSNGLHLPTRATILFTEMVDLFLNGNSHAKPSPALFQLILDSLNSQGNQTEVLNLWRLWQQAQRHDPALQEDSVGLHARLSDDSHGRDVSILCHLLTTTTRPEAIDAGSLQCFMDALARSGEPGSGRRAEGNLLKMQELFDQGILDSEPTFATFQKVIDSWINSKEDGFAARADAVLKLAELLSQEGNEKLRPNYNGYLAVITAWSESYEEEAPDRILELITRMKNHRDQEDQNHVQDGILYSSLIQAYANSGKPDGAKLSQRVFGETPEKFKDTRLYNALIGAQGGDAISAESILQKMYREYLNGNDQVKPNTESFNQVIQAWSRSGSPMAAWRADGIFHWMTQLANSGQLSGVRPNGRTFDMVISTLANELGADAAFKVEHYLGLLKEYYHSGNPDCVPSVSTYTEAIRAWGSHLDDPRSVLRAKALLDEMHELAKSGVGTVRPNRETYSIYLQALAKSSFEPKAELAENVTTMMKSDGILLEGPLIEYLQRCLLPKKAVLSGWTVHVDANGDVQDFA